MKVLSFMKYAFSVVGMFLLMGAGAIYKSSSDFIGAAFSTAGTVVALEQSRNKNSATYAPVVQFLAGQDEPVEFTSSIGSNPASYHIGERVSVLYLPKDPYDAKLNDFFALWGAPIIMGALGGMFFIIGLALMLFARFRIKRVEQLKRHGVAVQADFHGVEQNHSVSVNGRSPYQVVCHWLNPQTSELHRFKSENIWFDPTEYVISEKIKVFVGRGDARKYHVDISFLPKLAG